MSAAGLGSPLCGGHACCCAASAPWHLLALPPSPSLEGWRGPQRRGPPRRRPARHQPARRMAPPAWETGRAPWAHPARWAGVWLLPGRWLGQGGCAALRLCWSSALLPAGLQARHPSLSTHPSPSPRQGAAASSDFQRAKRFKKLNRLLNSPQARVVLNALHRCGVAAWLLAVAGDVWSAGRQQQLSWPHSHLQRWPSVPRLAPPQVVRGHAGGDRAAAHRAVCRHLPPDPGIQ